MNAKAKPAPLAAAMAAIKEQGTSTTAAAAALPAIGSQVMVVDPQGALPNLETGQRFEAGVATPQRVTVHTLQRLQDGCLVLAEQSPQPAA
jgi:hypothetical protein